MTEGQRIINVLFGLGVAGMSIILIYFLANWHKLSTKRTYNKHYEEPLSELEGFRPERSRLRLWKTCPDGEWHFVLSGRCYCHAYCYMNAQYDCYREKQIYYFSKNQYCDTEEHICG